MSEYVISQQSSVKNIILRYELLRDTGLKRHVHEQLSATGYAELIKHYSPTAHEVFVAVGSEYICDRRPATSDVTNLTGIPNSSARRGLSYLERVGVITHTKDRRDGRRRFVELTKNYQKIIDSFVINCAIEFADIINHFDRRERESAEEALFNKNALLQCVLDSSEDCIFVKDTQLRTILCNDYYAHVYGKEANDFYGKTDFENGLCAELVYDDPDKGIRGFETDDKDVLKGITIRNRQDPAEINGQPRHFETVKTPIYGKLGNIIGILGISRDITERQQAEDTIRNRETHLNNIQRITQIGSFETSINEEKLWWSMGLYEIFGLDLTQYIPIKEAFFDLLHPDDRDEYYEALMRSVESGKFLKARFRANKCGEWRYYETRADVIVDDNGESVCLRGYVQDITERQQAEEALRKSEERYALVEVAVNDGIWDWNILTHENYLSLRWKEILGYVDDELPNIESTFFDLVHPDDRAILDEAIQKHLEEEEFFKIEIRMRHKDGSYSWIMSRGEAIHDTNGDPVRMVGSITDLTERKQAEEELQKLSRAVEYSPAAVPITDRDGNIEYVNPKFTEITGYTREEAIGQNISILQSEETPESIYDEIWETIRSGDEWKGELHNRKKDGSLHWIRSSISGVKDSQGNITHYIAIQEDISHEHALAEQLTYQASHDVLTGLINRREFERRAERLLSSVKQNKETHALCYMDLDQFKVINDTCGHLAGDELLRQLSMVLQEAVRKRDTLARLGGDEFAVLMEHCSLDQARRVAKSLQKVIQEYEFFWEEHVFKVGVSIGLVTITETTANLTELLKEADVACYMAKDLGRNRIHVYHREDESLAQRHGEMQWVERIHGALEENRFCLYAQTIEPLDGSDDKHYELLVRMLDETGEVISPDDFLPAAERYNLIEKVDAWVIERAFALLAAHPAFLRQIQFVSINLSGQSLNKPEILDFIITQLDTSGIEAEKICFEITETAAIANMSTAIKFISTLKGLDCRFALDAFGSGFSSFAYLKNLPVDYLKIDGLFVKDIVDDPIDRAMVKSINEIGHVMGMQTIAEFVENDAIKEMLKEIGVNYAQGYAIGKPQPFVMPLLIFQL